jgi:hypothetical protein
MEVGNRLKCATIQRFGNCVFETLLEGKPLESGASPSISLRTAATGMARWRSYAQGLHPAADDTQLTPPASS